MGVLRRCGQSACRTPTQNQHALVPHPVVDPRQPGGNRDTHHWLDMRQHEHVAVCRLKLDAFNDPRQNKRHPMNSTTIPTQVCFDGMDASDALRGRIEQRVQRLSSFAGDIEACRVTPRACEHRHRRDNRYNVHTRVMMHGRIIETGHTPVPDLAHDDPCAAVAQTFDSLRRRIEDHVRRRRGDVKTRMKD